ncbi:MAG: hypothetical protein QM763_07690 [Agriterribacter sp.]
MQRTCLLSHYEDSANDAYLTLTCVYKQIVHIAQKRKQNEAGK